MWLSLYQFFFLRDSIIHASMYHFRWKGSNKAPNYAQIVCFLQQFAHNNPMYGISVYKLGSFVSDENPPIAVPNITKSTPKDIHEYVYHVIVRTPWIISTSIGNPHRIII